jgi:Protein of unknown function (DUF2911)
MKTATCLLISFLLAVLCLSCRNQAEKKGAPVASTGGTDTIHPARQKKMTNPYASIDISPMDMSYYPPDYPILKMNDPMTAPPLARVIYSRPHLEGRQLFHDILKYGEPWRLGANEATELQLYRDAMIQDKKIKAGRYVLYCVPQANKWTIHFNSNIDSWGLKPDSTKDIASFEIPIRVTDRHLEYFTIVFEYIGSGTQLLMSWDNVEARLPIRF